jgi:hypothetical protein
MLFHVERRLDVGTRQDSFAGARMSATTLLDRMDRPKQTRPGSWTAGCPCCQSKRGRPISIRELDDGRVLLHSFCGCETESVLTALGLCLSDLYPQRMSGSGPGGGFASSHARVSARDLLALLDHEITVASLILADVLSEHMVTEEMFDRLAQAAAQVGRAKDYLRA